MYPPEIIAAVSEGDTQFVRRWLNKRTRDLNQTVNIYYGSLLLLCISNNYVDDRAELVQLLVANGADVRWENVAGFSLDPHLFSLAGGTSCSDEVTLA